MNDGGLFLDQWAAIAAEGSWIIGEVFDVPYDGSQGGLIWFLAGELIEAFSPKYARTASGRVFDRMAIRSGGA